MPSFFLSIGESFAIFSSRFSPSLWAVRMPFSILFLSRTSCLEPQILKPRHGCGKFRLLRQITDLTGQILRMVMAVSSIYRAPAVSRGGKTQEQRKYRCLAGIFRSQKTEHLPVGNLKGQIEHPSACPVTFCQVSKTDHILWSFPSLVSFMMLTNCSSAKQLPQFCKHSKSADLLRKSLLSHV